MLRSTEQIFFGFFTLTCDILEYRYVANEVKNCQIFCWGKKAVWEADALSLTYPCLEMGKVDGAKSEYWQISGIFWALRPLPLILL